MWFLRRTRFKEDALLFHIAESADLFSGGTNGFRNRRMLIIKRHADLGWHITYFADVAKLGRLTKRYSYNAFGQFTQIVRYKDTDGGSTHEVATALYTYDDIGRLTDLAYQKNSSNLFTPYEWTFDPMNRITQFVGQDGTSDYSYDKTSQLTGEDHDYQTDEYTREGT